MKHVSTTFFLANSSFERLDLPADAAHSVKQFLFLANGMAHAAIKNLYTPMGIISGDITERRTGDW